MVIVNNFRGFPPEWEAAGGERGTSCQAESAADFLKRGGEIGETDPDVIFLVNCEPRLTLELGAARMARRTNVPVVSVDLVMRAPSTWTERAAFALKRPFLGQIDLFIHYFRDCRRYSEAFGISAERQAFVPFKVNLGIARPLPPEPPDGEYVLCFGRSLRDFDTFFDAMELSGRPGAIARPDPLQLRTHHARFTRPANRLPANVRVLDDDGSEESQVRILQGARIVVIPILKASVVASGISTCLNAMALGRCVIGTEGPGMSDVFDNEIIAVPPEDPAALAAAIGRAWDDDTLRAKVARAGYQYAVKAGGEQELYQRIIDQLALWYRQGRRLSPAKR